MAWSVFSAPALLVSLASTSAHAIPVWRCAFCSKRSFNASSNSSRSLVFIDIGCSVGSGTFVLGVPRFRLPELDLVVVRVHDPRELPVLVRFGSLDDRHPVRTQLLQQL